MRNLIVFIIVLGLGKNAFGTYLTGVALQNNITYSERISSWYGYDFESAGGETDNCALVAIIVGHGSSITNTSITRTTSKTITCTDVQYTGAMDYIDDGCDVCETHPYINYSECIESSAEAMLLDRMSVNENHSHVWDPDGWYSPGCGLPLVSQSQASTTSSTDINLTTICQDTDDKVTEMQIYGRASVQDVTTPSEIKINNTSPIDLNQYDEDPSPSRWAGYLTWKIPVLIACGDNYNLKLDVANGNVRVSSIKTTIIECHLTIDNLYSSISKFNPSNGETVTVSGSILETTGKNVIWSLSVAGRSFSGTGKTVSVEWDGKDASGNIVTPGSYTATLTANTDDGVCERLKSIQVTVDNCSLQITQLISNNPTIYPNSGVGATFEGIISQNTEETVNWTLSIAGRSFSGVGKLLSVLWDGKDAINRIVDPGEYHAILHAVTEDGMCPVSATASVVVDKRPEEYDDCLKVTTGSSTNITNGGLSMNQPLFALRGTTLPLTIELHYGSLNPYDGPLGLGWSHNYDIHLTENSDGSVLMREGNGERRRYVKSDISYISSPGDFSVLTKNADGTYVLMHRNGDAVNFRADGKISSFVDKYNNAITFSYINDDLDMVINSARRTVKFNYDTSITPHRLLAITHPTQNTYDFYYQGDTLWKIVNPPSNPATPETRGYWEYAYAVGTKMLKSKRDPNGNVTAYDYDELNRMWKSVDPEGDIDKGLDPDDHTRLLLYNDEPGSIKTTTFTEKDGGVWTYIYDSLHGRLIQKIAPNFDGSANGKSTFYYYYDNGTIKAKTEPYDGEKALTTFYTYDSYDNLLTETDPVDLSIYSPAIDPATVDVTTLATMMPPIKPAIAYSYDYQNNDQLMSVADYRSVPPAVMLYDRYEENGLQVTKITDALSRVSYVKRNSAGLIKEYIDANGKSTHYEYYPDTAENRSAGLAWMLWKVNGSDGVVMMYSSYDKLGNATEIEVIDSTGQVRSTAANEYDALGRLRKITTTTVGLSPIITTYGYDDNGNVTSVIDAEGNEVKYEFTYDRQIKSITQYKSGTPVVTNYEYSATGCASCGGGGGDRLTHLVDAKQQGTSFQYDKLGRLEYEIDPLGNKLHYTYYDNNLMKERYDATTVPEKLLTTYVYNNHGQITDKIHTDGTAWHSTYYPDRRLQTISNQNITYTYEWYANGWLKSVIDDQGRRINYEYDNIGQRKKVTLLAGTPDQRVITYEYDSANRPWTITSNAGTFTYAYDDLGRRDTVSYPNGTVADYDFDDLGRLTGITQKSTCGTPFAAYTYPLLDKVGNRKTSVRNGTEFTHLYDGLYRLWNTLWSTEKEEFIYDSVGNRTIGPGAKDIAYLHNTGNQITKGRKFGYTYDVAGNQTSRTLEGVTDKIWTQTWDNENRLIIVEKTKGAEKKTVTFSYDPLGRRIGKQLTRIVEGETKINSWSYVYDNESLMVEIFTDDTGNVNKTFHTHGPWVDEHLAMERNGSFYYFHQDGIRSVTVITDSSRNVVQSYEYDSFGMPKPSTSFRNTYQFAGRPWDKETGLYYNDARYYDPMEGRFISRDPIGIYSNIYNNQYMYVENNPINKIDPTGLASTTWVDFFTKGRAPWDGPRNGNWGGKNWSGGRDSSLPPADSADVCYKQHDQCYAFVDNESCGKSKIKITCDQSLVVCLKSLSNNSKNWLYPPNPGTERASEIFRNFAVDYFSNPY